MLIVIVDAAVIGGYDRWVRRLAGLKEELRKRIDELGADDEHVRLRLERELDHLGTLQRFALPIIHFLARTPGNTAWKEWLDWLEQLTTMAIRQPETILLVLAELRPMGNVSPVGHRGGICGAFTMELTGEPEGLTRPANPS